MIVRDIRISECANGLALTANVVLEGAGATQAFPLRYLVRAGQPDWLAPSGDVFVASLLQLAMARHENLVIEGTVSPRLLRNLPTIMQIYRQWLPGLRPIDVLPASTAAYPRGAARGLFFSGGVDSFYSLLKDADRNAAADPISHLVLVFGFDVRLNNPILFEQIAARVQDVAAATGKRAIVVETNIRELSDSIAGWDLYHGGPMAAVGLALSGLLGRVVIASSYAYQELHPWGSHPLLDPLWSTEGIDFYHDGCEATRLQKIRRIATSDLALRSLRVCWQNDDTKFNCGRCEKCLRTMMSLRVTGALDRCPVFAQPLTPSAVRRITVGSEHSEIFLREILGALGTAREERSLAKAIHHALSRSRRRAWAGALLRNHLGGWATLPGLRRALKPARKPTSPASAA